MRQPSLFRSGQQDVSSVSHDRLLWSQVSSGGPLPPVSTLTSLHSLSASPASSPSLIMASLPSVMSLGESSLLIGNHRFSAIFFQAEANKTSLRDRCRDRFSVVAASDRASHQQRGRRIHHPPANLLSAAASGLTTAANPTAPPGSHGFQSLHGHHGAAALSQYGCCIITTPLPEFIIASLVSDFWKFNLLSS